MEKQQNSIKINGHVWASFISWVPFSFIHVNGKLFISCYHNK